MSLRVVGSGHYASGSRRSNGLAGPIPPRRPVPPVALGPTLDLVDAPSAGLVHRRQRERRIPGNSFVREGRGEGRHVVRRPILVRATVHLLDGVLQLVTEPVVVPQTAANHEAAEQRRQSDDEDDDGRGEERKFQHSPIVMGGDAEAARRSMYCN